MKASESAAKCSSSTPDYISDAKPIEKGAKYIWFFFTLFFTYFAIIFLLHRSGFNASLVYDSEGFILDQVGVFALRDPVAVMRLFPSRPLFMLSLYFNYMLTGMEPYAFRLLSSAILAATGVMLVLLCKVFLGTEAVRRSVENEIELDVRSRPSHLRFLPCGVSEWAIPVFVGLLFIVHPLQTFIVLYVWQRQTLMACFFYFAAVTAYFAVRNDWFRKPAVGYLLTAVAIMGGMACKESAVTIPAVLAIGELLLWSSTSKQLIRRMLTILAVTVPAAICYALVTHLLSGAENTIPSTPSGLTLTAALQQMIGGLWISAGGTEPLGFLKSYYGAAGLSVSELLLTQCRVICDYIVMIAAPLLDPPLLITAKILSKSLWDPAATVPAVAIVAALIGVGIGLIRKAPWASFGIFFFLITLLPDSLFVPQYMSFAYRPILASAGILLILSELLSMARRWAVLQQRRSWRVAGSVALTVYALCLAGETFVQARNWNVFQIWREAYVRLPRPSGQVESIPYIDVVSRYGDVLLKLGRPAEALDAVRSSLDVQPQWDREKGLSGDPDCIGSAGRELWQNISVFSLQKVAKIHCVVGSALQDLGMLDEAEKEMRKALSIDPKSSLFHTCLGDVYRKRDKTKEAIKHYERALALNPNFSVAYNNLGLCWEREGCLSCALASYRKCLRLRPDTAEAHYNLGNILFRTGNVQAAIQSYQRATDLRKKFPEAEANLGIALLASGRPGEAVARLAKAVMLNEQDAQTHFLLGLAYEQAGRTSGALAEFKRAVEIDPEHMRAKESLERLAPVERLESSR